VPVYNEQESILKFHGELSEVLDVETPGAKILYVDDGSTDGTCEVLQQLAGEHERVAVIKLSRNFGHQAALSAGLAHAQGEAVITMDGDGQHPPELIPKMIDRYQVGHELVLTQRVEKRKFSSPKWIFSALFYRLISRLSETSIHPGSADFRLMSRKVVDVINAMPEYHRFLRGLVAWVGFDPVILPYSPAERIAGESKYSLRKMAKLALDAIFSFSLIPLWIGLVLGMIFILLAGLESAYVLSFWVRGMQDALEPGWSSLMFILLLVGGILLVFISIVGMYVGYILQEVKNRPVYIIQERTQEASRKDQD
jgi:dolichol-phosphate mannosyltransferase